MQVRIPYLFASDASSIKSDGDDPHPVWPRIAEAIQGEKAVTLDVSDDEALELWEEADYRRECLSPTEHRGLRNSAIQMLKNLDAAGFVKSKGPQHR